MYSFLLSLHSITRWLVVITLFYIIVSSYIKQKYNKGYLNYDNVLKTITVSLLHTQLLIGFSLYILSPLVEAFYTNFSENIHQRQIRFFGMEHITVMTIAVIIITIGSSKAKKKTTNFDKHKTIFIWFLIGLLLILSSIPWSFSPLINRPNFRGF